METRKINRGALAWPLLAGVLGLVLFTLAAGYGHVVLGQVVESTAQRKQGRILLLRATELMSLIKDVETGQRGFVLTGDTAYLTPYEAARNRLWPELTQLLAELRKSPELPRMDALDQHVTERLAVAARVVELRRGQGKDAALAAILSGEGKTSMDVIRAEFARLKAAIGLNLEAQDARVRMLQARAGQVGGMLVSLAGLLLVLAYGLLLREQARRLQAERAQGEAAVAEARAREQAEAQRHVVDLLERMTNGFVALDRDWRYTYVNAEGARLLGREPAALLGRHIWTEFPEGESQPFAEAYRRVMQSRQPLVIEAHYQPWDRWFENRVYPTENGIAIYFLDITERRRAEAELRQARDDLRAFAVKLDRDIEDERRRLAREVHDQLGQIFTALKLNLLVAPPDPARAGEFEALLDEGIRVARRISADLRPPMLDDLGLGPALNHFAQSLGRQAGLSVEVEVAEEVRLGPERANQLFRIAQEALTNVVRHAGARRARVRGIAAEGCFRFSVEDDGRGAEALGEGGQGMLGMRERAALIGAELAVGVSEWGGLRLSLTLPLEEGEERHAHPDGG